MNAINPTGVGQNGAMPLAGSVSHNQTAAPGIDNTVVAKAIAASAITPSNVVQAAAPTKEVVAKAAEQLQSFVQSMGRNLNFSVDPTTGFHVVTVVNPETNEVVRQLPSKELLAIAQTMATLHNGLVSQRA